MQVLLSSDASPDKFNNSLRGLAIPDTYRGKRFSASSISLLWKSDYPLTIARNDKKLVVLRNFMSCHIGIGRDNLLFWGQVGALLELEIAQRAGQGQVSVDSAKVNKSTSCTNARLFACCTLC